MFLNLRGLAWEAAGVGPPLGCEVKGPLLLSPRFPERDYQVGESGMHVPFKNNGTSSFGPFHSRSLRAVFQVVGNGVIYLTQSCSTELSSPKKT